MLIVKVASETDLSITAFEVGTLSDFEKRRLSDPLWKFIDRDKAFLRSNISDFLKDPNSYMIGKHGDLRKK